MSNQSTTDEESDSLLRAVANAPPLERPTIFSGEPGAAEPVKPFTDRFRLISELARGGMGRILIAHDESLHREVAIKELLRGGPVALRRFEREAMLTARLQHPGIVSVYELVRREKGELALVMRRVRGRPFEELIEGTRTLADRLALLAPFTAACDAVAYAHKEQVIHRDLKPANVLLGDFGDTVVIDWGLAKDLKKPSDDEVDGAKESPALAKDLTAEGSVMGTPVYMSPEQARGEPADARTDVYALGAMLYELLAGRRAYHRESDVRAVLQAVRSGPPEPILDVVPALAPELATLVGRAMARDPNHRYANAGELAAELKRFQTGRLVLSHSYSVRELVRRWIRRHAAMLSLSTAFILLLSIVGAISVRRVVSERDRANREAEVSKRVSDFMVQMFHVYDPSESRGNSITAREILEKANGELESGMARDPLIQARLMHSIGNVYRSLGLYKNSEEVLRKVVEIRRRMLGVENPDTTAALSDLALSLSLLGRFAEAEQIHRDLVNLRTRLLGPEHKDTLASKFNLGLSLRDLGKLEEAEQIYNQVLEIRRRTIGENDLETIDVLAALGRLWYDDGRTEMAEGAQREVLEVRRRLLGSEHLETLKALSALANTLVDLEQLGEAEKLHREVLRIRLKVLGHDHPDTLISLSTLAAVLDLQGEDVEAERLARDAYDSKRRLLGADHPSSLDAVSILSQILWNKGELPEADRLQRVAADGLARTLGKDHRDTIGATLDIAPVLDAEGRADEAEKIYQQGVASYRRVLGPDDPVAVRIVLRLADHFDLVDRFSQAEPLYRQVLGIQNSKLGGENPEVMTTADNLAHDLNRQGRHAEAEKIVRGTLPVWQRLFPERLVAPQSLLADCLEAQGRAAEAEGLRRSALELEAKKFGKEHPDTLELASALVGTLLSEGRAAEAEQLGVETLAAQRHLRGDEHSTVLLTKIRLARAQAAQGRVPEAEQLLHEVLRIQRTRWSATLSTTLFELGCTATRRGDRAGALKWLREAVATRPNPELAEAMAQREELGPLRKNAEFASLLKKAGEGASR